MLHSRSTGFFLLSLTVFIAIAGQIAGKFGAQLLQTGHSLFNFPVILGYILLLLRGVLWILALRRLPLSVAYPMTSLTLIGVFLISFLLFQEPISLPRLLGMMSILGGVFLLGTEHEDR